MLRAVCALGAGQLRAAQGDGTERDVRQSCAELEVLDVVKHRDTWSHATTVHGHGAGDDRKHVGCAGASLVGNVLALECDIGDRHRLVLGHCLERVPKPSFVL